MKVLIGITGGIAAYKVADLVRLFAKEGHEVKTVLTENAKKFVTPVTLETLSKNRCYWDLFSEPKDIEHIELTKWADIMIIAPASANFLGKIAGGICDDLLTTIVLALDKPCYIFPSMNTNMYLHPAVQQNITQLRDWGYVVYEPDEGELACGDAGKGRLPDVEMIYEIVLGEIARSEIKSTLSGKKVLVTAGATKAYIDPVRFIANKSSGTMGVELAREAWLRGAEVNLVCSNEVVQKFPHVLYYVDSAIIVETTDDVIENIEEVFDDSDIYISAAAFCDFKNNPSKKKIKRSDSGNMLNLEPATDVFKELSKRRKNQLMVGFALESDDMEDNAKVKLATKGMDLVIGNTVDSIGASSASVAMLDAKGLRRFVKDKDKRIIASEIMDEIEKIIADKKINTQSKEAKEEIKIENH